MSDQARAESNDEVGTLGSIVRFFGMAGMILGIIYAFVAVGCGATTAGMTGASSFALIYLPVLIPAGIMILFGFLIRKYAYRIENLVLNLTGQLKDA